MILKTGKRRFLCQKLNAATQVIRPPDRRNLREGKVLILGCAFSYNARYVKQREVKKPSFPDFGSFGVPPAFRPPKPRFAGFAAIYLFLLFYILLL